MHRQPVPHCLHTAEGLAGAPWGLFDEGANSIQEDPTLMASPPPGTPPPNPFTLGTRFQHMNLGRGRGHKHSVRGGASLSQQPTPHLASMNGFSKADMTSFLIELA